MKSFMKLSLNLTRDMLSKPHMRFAKQAGCSGVIVHLNDYNRAWSGEKTGGVPLAAEHDPIWEYDSLKSIKKLLTEEGLEWYGIENFSPADWYDVLLDGPRKEEQLEYLKTTG
jgi:mannonate dehydratase